VEETMPPAIVAAGIGAVGAIGGGLLASSGASKASNAQQKSDAAAIAEQQREYDTTRSDFAPYLGFGKSAMGPLGDLIGLNGNDASAAAINALKASPMYQSLFNTGQEAILQNASATGGVRGGNTQGALYELGSNTLSDVIQNQIRNLFGATGVGQGATSSVANVGQNTANQISAADIASGNARASGDLASSGAWSGVLNNLVSQITRIAEPHYSGGF
jgi:hypothetical protein